MPQINQSHKLSPVIRIYVHQSECLFMINDKIFRFHMNFCILGGSLMNGDHVRRIVVAVKRYASLCVQKKAMEIDIVFLMKLVVASLQGLKRRATQMSAQNGFPRNGLGYVSIFLLLKLFITFLINLRNNNNTTNPKNHKGNNTHIN